MNATFYGKKEFADVMKLKLILRGGDYSGLFTWARDNHKCPYQRAAREARVKEEACVMMETQTKAVNFESGESWPQAKGSRPPLWAEKIRKKHSPWNL